LQDLQIKIFIDDGSQNISCSHSLQVIESCSTIVPVKNTTNCSVRKTFTVLFMVRGK